MIPSIMAARFREGLKDYIVVHVILILRFIFRDKGQEFLLLLAQSYLKLYYEKRTAPVWRRPGKGMGKNMKSIVIISAGLPAGWDCRVSRSGEHRSAVR